MKKAIVVILLACYLAVTSGVIVNFHYCMDKLASTELFAGAGKKCGKCGMHTDQSHGCCHDEVKIVKMDNDQKVSQELSFSFNAVAILSHAPSAFLVSPFLNTTVTKLLADHSPPFSEQDIYLRNGVFRI